MLKPVVTNRFKKDVDLVKKRGLKADKLKDVMKLLIEEQPLSPKLYYHPLIGNFVGRRECHVEPNWLLIYKLDAPVIIFERTGTHSDLY